MAKEYKFKFPVQVSTLNHNEERLKSIFKKVKGKTGKTPRLTKHNRKG